MLRRPSSLFVVRCPSSTMFKHLLLRNRLANQSQISCGASLGRGNESLYKWFRSHDQDGRHAHIWYSFFFKRLFILQLQLPLNIHFANTKTGLTRLMRKLSCFLMKNTACTRLLPRYQSRLPTAIFVRQSKTGSGTCKTPS